MRQNEATGRVANFLKAAGKLEGAYKGQRYNDSYVYKTIEAASYSLAPVPDAGLDRQLDTIIAAIAAAFERTLYNGYLSGVSIAGNAFFYQNPLESDGSHERSEYFGVACPPANLARLMAQLPGLIYATRGDTLFVNLFIGSTAKATVANGAVVVRQQTRYPWDGVVRIAVDPEKPTEFALHVRIPGWARNQAIPSDLYRFASRVSDTARVAVNGRALPLAVLDGFQTIRRRWQRGDVVELTLPRPPRRVLANDGVADDRGKAAIQRGPLVYAVEAVDNGGRALDIVLPLETPLQPEFRRDLLNGIDVITARVSPHSAPARTVTAVPLALAARQGHTEVIRLLLDAGEGPNRYKPKGNHGHSPPPRTSRGDGIPLIRTPDGNPRPHPPETTFYETPD